MAEPLVSIIVNNCNYGRYLAEAIDSALAQDYANVEVIVVDDGSTDQSRAVLAGYADRVCPILKDNGGQGSAFNAGFAAAHGAVVNFLDADDHLAPDATRRAAAAMTDRRVAHWLAPLALIDAAGQALGRVFPAVPLADGDLRHRLLTFGPWAYPSTPNTGNFWARWYLEQVLPMPAERYRLGGDEYLAALSPLYGQVASSPLPGGDYRVHGANAYWRPRLHLEDVADDAFYFQRISNLMSEHATRLGLAVAPDTWPRRDWRQQVRLLLLARSGRRPQSPRPAEVLEAALTDQTRPLKKAVLLPLLAALLALPRRPAVAMGLKLLDRG